MKRSEGGTMKFEVRRLSSDRDPAPHWSRQCEVDFADFESQEEEISGPEMALRTLLLSADWRIKDSPANHKAYAFDLESAGSDPKDASFVAEHASRE